MSASPRAPAFLLNVYKPKGITCANVVNVIRTTLERAWKKQVPVGASARLPVGHGGTLDLDASGVLVVGVEREATRALAQLLSARKSYSLTVCFGEQTDTDDSSGAVIQRRSYDHVTEQALRAVLPQFTGAIMQTPPMASAVKINGQRCYQLLRQGVVAERQPRPRTVYSLDCEWFQPPRARLRCSCSSGTYMRVLASDIAARLDTVAHCADIERHSVAGFRLEDAIRPDHSTGSLHLHWPIDRLAAHAIPVKDLPRYL